MSYTFCLGCFFFLILCLDIGCIVLCTFLHLYSMIALLVTCVLINAGSLLHASTHFLGRPPTFVTIKRVLCLHSVLSIFLSATFVFLFIKQEITEHEDVYTKGATQWVCFTLSLIYNFVVDIVIFLYHSEAEHALLPLNYDNIIAEQMITDPRLVLSEME